MLVTEGAFEGPVLAVQDHVFFKVRPACEGLQTHLEDHKQAVSLQTNMQSHPTDPGRKKVR